MKPRSFLFLLWALQALGALVWLYLLPSSSEKGLIPGFSVSRLALLAGMIALLACSALLYWARPFTPANLLVKLRQPVFLLALAAALAAPALILILNALGETSGSQYSAYAGRLAPLAAWLALSLLELAVLLVLEQRREDLRRPEVRAFFRVMLTAALGLACLAAFIIISRLGITRYNDGSWGEPTTPLLEWQILLALTSSLIFINLQARWKWLQQDRYIFLAIYLLTCLLWLSQPVNPGWFATPPRAPNFEIYPFSDALIYAQYAQSALVGNGFMWPDVPTRPLYIAFLTWLHALVGQDYTHVIALQTLLLALFPPVLYLLGKELSGRPLGLGLALLAALRDLTANIAAPFALNYTYTKLFFSEIPAALLLSLFTLLALRWMRAPKPAWYPFLAGGLLGLAALIRLQSAVALAAVIPLAFFVMKNRKRWLTGSALLVLGLALALTPWLARNYRATGGLVLDNPISQSMVLARRWGGDSGNTLIPRLPGEGTAQYSNRMGGLALASLKANPGRILGSAANHFLNNEIGNLLVFPLRDQLDSPLDLLWPSRAFWQSWAGQPTAGEGFVIVFYVLLFAAGMAAALTRNGLAGLLPLVLSVFYNAWTALFLSSGDRFLVPVDWGAYFYTFLGLLTLANLVINGRLPHEPISQSAAPEAVLTPSWRRLALTGVFILLCGASVPLTEAAFPRKYPALIPQQASAVQEVTVAGRALYPRWYKSGDGEPGSAKLGYGESKQARLVFFLAGGKDSLVIFPLQKTPGFFPNAADVTITGSLQNGYILAREINLQAGGRSALYQAK